MTPTIVNAAPMTRMLGIEDLSTRALVPEPEAIPTHLPKIYVYAQKGPLDPQLVSGNSMTKMYGVDSFDLRKPWATHATVLANLINAKGNSIMMQRVKPADANGPATIRLYLDVLPTNVPEYTRNTDGSYQLDTNNQPVPTGTTIAGFQVKWVAAQISANNFGAGATLAGDQTDATTHTQSQRFPIMDLEVSDFGAYGNNQGLRFWAPTSVSGIPVKASLLANEKVYPFRMACVARPDALTTPSVVQTTSAEQYVDVCLKPGTIDKTTDAQVYVGDVFIDAYQNLTDPSLPPQFGPFGRFKLYDDHVASLLEMFYTAETPYINSFSDFTGDADELFRFNMVSGTSSNAVPYQSFIVVSNASNGIYFTENTTVYAQGGSDGTMTETLFAELVATAVADYADDNSVLQDTAKYPESIIYDSGFPLTTKYALCSFIAARKDTAVVLSTHDVLGQQLTASEESALAIALRTRLQMFPESEYYGTSTVRGVIIGRSGKLINSQYTKPLPLTLEIATKAAAYMGASNGSWKAGFSFDQSPNNNVSMFTQVNVTFTPATVRNKDWSNGLNWVESFSRRSLYFPALKTVYDNDTSVLNSFFTMMACVELEKVGDRARREFSGVSSLTNAQLIERVNRFVTENTTGRFDGRFVIVPAAYFTEADIARGYSWTLPIKIYAPNMKTVQTLTIQAYRIEDLQQ
jgi:hypothetical protein